MRNEIDRLEAEIATLRQELDECCEFCNKPHFSGAGEAQGMEVCTDCWNDQFRRREAAEAENARLRAALQRAVETIRTWHGMGLSDTEQKAWALYQFSPEMQAINALLAPPAETDR